MTMGNVYRGVVRQHIGTVECINTLYFKQLSSGGDLGGLADAIDSTIFDAMHSIQGPSWKVDDITLSELVVGGGEQLIEPSSTVGTAAIGAGPTTGAACVSLRSSLAGRSHRGRNFFPIARTDMVTAGLVLSAFYTPLEAAYNAFLAEYGDAGTDTDYTWGIWSRKLGETLDSGGHVTAYDPSAGFFPMHFLTVDTVARVQRRREVGVGV